jgi:hypothetical protein
MLKVFTTTILLFISFSLLAQTDTTATTTADTIRLGSFKIIKKKKITTPKLLWGVIQNNENAMQILVPTGGY